MGAASGQDIVGVESPSLRAAVAAVPSGRWAVAVSGGADSVALLELLVERNASDLSLTVAHLDHETRGGASGEDAAFVRELAARHGLACAVARRSQVEPILVDPPANRSALFRAVRLAWFARVVAERALDGVVLAHHADDRAETIMQRLLRGSSVGGLDPLRVDAIVSGVRIVRPLLGVTGAALRTFLRGRGVAWREDASNESLDQQRNRVRAMLTTRPDVTAALLRLGDTAAAVHAWLAAATPTLSETFEVSALHSLPPPVAREAARRWLAARGGGGGGEVTHDAADRLVAMACDAATPAKQDFPGGLSVRRRVGRVFAS